MTTPQRKRSAATPSPELDFAATQEIDPALVEAILNPREATLMPGDFDDTEVLDLGKPRKPTQRR
jgi:hypothetical protein